MKNRLMIYIPLLLFISASVVLGMALLGQKSNNRIEIPIVLQKPLEVVEDIPTTVPTIIATPTPIDPSTQIESDLNLIMQDISRVKVEDARFKPPSFVFEMEI